MKQFENKEDLFDYLQTNKNLLKLDKLSTIKHADCLFNSNISQDIVSKAKPMDDEEEEEMESGKIKVKVAINTTNIMDSHDDVHFPGIWNKSLKENKLIYHLKEHNMNFDSVISDNVKASAEMMDWKDLGFKFPGQTQVLVFESEIELDNSAGMGKKYLESKVKNHSVGMRYVKLELAMNSNRDEDKAEKKIWDKYISQIINKEQAEEKGYFWAVLEAKVIEGSAVLLGSNPITPTIDIEPVKTTQKEPINITPEKVDWKSIINQIKNQKI